MSGVGGTIAHMFDSAASRLTFAPVSGDQCLGSCRGEPDELIHLGERVTSQGRTDETFRIVTGDGAEAGDVLAEEWLPGVASQAPRPAGGAGSPDWVSGTTIPGVGFVPPDVVAALTGRLDTGLPGPSRRPDGHPPRDEHPALHDPRGPA